MYIRFGFLDRIPTIPDLLRCTLGAYAINGSVRLFKRVNLGLSSEHDPSFFIHHLVS